MTGTNNMIDVNAEQIMEAAEQTDSEGQRDIHALGHQRSNFLYAPHLSLERVTGLPRSSSALREPQALVSERVCARKGNGGLNHGGGFIGGITDIGREAQSLFDSTLSKMSRRVLTPNSPLRAPQELVPPSANPSSTSAPQNTTNASPLPGKSP